MRASLMLAMLFLAFGSVSAGILRDQFKTRCKDFLAYSAGPDGGGATWADLARLALNTGTVSGAGLESSMADMANRKDCSDFDVTGMIRMLWMYRNSSLWPAGLADKVEAAIRGWQFWIDEANGFQGNMMFWTENHQMDFHTSEYLAGALFKDKFFPGTNMTGQQHMDKGRNFVLQWMERRYRWGFQEWKSETYLQFDVISLTNLATLAPEVEVSRRAAMVLDLLLYDLSIHSHKGAISSSRGRSYGGNKLNVTNQGVATIVNLMSAQTAYIRTADGPSVAMCLSNLLGLYTVPEAVLAISADHPEELENTERIGIDPTMAALAEETGLGYKAPNDGIVWWGMEAYAHPLTIHLAFEMGNAWNLYNSNETIWHYFRLLLPFANSTDLPLVCSALWPASNSILGPITSYIYRTPDVALASALDYRPGVIGFQQHAWQATANGTALVFTTQRGPLGTPDLIVHAIRNLLNDYSTNGRPLSQEETDARVVNAFKNIKGLNADYADGYWTGSASMPRVGQSKDFLIALYNPPWNGEPPEIFPPRTHAYFPKSQFDQVTDRLQDLGWIVGRQGNAYIALHASSNNITWVTKGEFANREIIAEGKRGAWVCIVGRQSIYQTFANFSAIIFNTTVNVTLDDTMAIAVQQPTGRRVTFGWGSTDFVIEETGKAPRVVPLSTKLRFDSPYAQADFPARDSLTLAFGNLSVKSNFDANTRVLTENDERAVDEALPNATAIGQAVASRVLSVWDRSDYPHFQTWGYEAGVIQLGLWELSNITNNISIQHACSKVLDGYLLDKSGLAYKIVHDDKIIFPWGYSIGDHIALYPIAYAARIRYSRDPSFHNASDIELCNAVAKKFVLGYPHRLPDGTVSRSIGWWKEDLMPHNASAVWVDDSFMGTALLSHSLSVIDNPAVYATYSANQLSGFLRHLRDVSTGLLHHGYDGARNIQSCCVWGRGNGWALMALTDLMIAVTPASPLFDELHTQYTDFCHALLPFQDAQDGRWHNILNDSATPLETSSTAFYIYSFAKGLNNGWLPQQPFASAVASGWAGLARQVAADGSVGGIVGETGIKQSAAEYDPGPTPYAHAAPGLGAVVRAIAAMVEYGL